MVSGQAATEVAIQQSIREEASRSLRRVGVGVHVLNVGDVDLKAGRFYADLQATPAAAARRRRGCRGLSYRRLSRASTYRTTCQHASCR